MGKSGRIVVKAVFPTMPQAMARLGVDEGGDVQRFITHAVARNLPDFMPRRTGELAAGVTEASPTLVRVVGNPGTRFLFFGVTATGEPVDYYTGANPRAGAHWDRRMVAERGRAITAEAQRRFGRR